MADCRELMQLVAPQTLCLPAGTTKGNRECSLATCGAELSLLRNTHHFQAAVAIAGTPLCIARAARAKQLAVLCIMFPLMLTPLHGADTHGHSVRPQQQPIQ